MSELDRFLNRRRPPRSAQPKLRPLRPREKPGVILAAIALGILAVGVLYAGWRVANSSLENDALSCLASAAGSVQRVGPDRLRQITRPTRVWHELSDDTTDQLFEVAHPTNCDGRNPKPPILDRWGQRIRVSVREETPGLVQFKFASNGADGRPDTKDDLVYPFPRPEP